MNKTNIEYLTHTWNPIAMRCTLISDGCRNCWHLAMAKRLAANINIDMKMRIAYAGGSPFLNKKELEVPLHLKKPSRIGVQFMGDLWHEKIDHFQIAQVWNIARQCQKHTFFFLTKRPDRLKAWTLVKSEVAQAHLPPIKGDIWPDNCWLGVSVEDQKTANKNIPILLQIPAAKRFISVEPMLGPVDLKLMGPGNFSNLKSCYGEGIHWVIAGGETGPHARPLHPDWVRSLRDQCQAAGVPFFFKGWGEWAPCDILHKQGYALKMPGPVMQFGEGEYRIPGRGAMMTRCGNKKAGHLIDGKEYREFPK